MQHQELAAFLVVLSLCGIVAFSIISEAANTTISTTTQTTSAASTSTSSASTSSTSTTASTTTVNAPSLSLVSAKASNSTATQNQTEQLTVNVTGGVPPYSYSFLISNSLTGNVLFGAQTTNSLPGNSVSFVLPIEANDVGQLRFTANVADSTGANVLGTGTITVNSVKQQASNSSTTSSSTTSSVSTSTTSSTNSSTSTTIPQQAYAALFNSSSGRYDFHGTVGPKAKIALSRSVLNGLNISFSAQGLQVNITISNSSALPSGVRPPVYPPYQFIQINGSVGTGKNNIDLYVSKAVYNFSVPVSWLAQHGASAANILLLKYSQGGWEPLSTSIVGSNSTYYFYSAVSNSLSDYAITYNTVNSVSVTSLAEATFTNTGFVGNFFWSASAHDQASVGSSSFTTNFIQIASASEALTGGKPGNRQANMSVVGYNQGPSGNMLTATGATGLNTTISGIGTNLLFANNEINAQTTTVNSLTYTTDTPNSVVILQYAIGGNSIKAVTLPAGGGCTVDNNANAINYWAGAAAANCITAGTGSFTTYMAEKSSSSIQAEANTISALVFPPYTVWLEDSPGSGGSILTANVLGNAVLQPSGSSVQELAGSTGTANAIPAAGYDFTGWSLADTANSANVVLSSTSSNQIYLTVMGNAIITADYAKAGITITSATVSNSVADQDQYETLNIAITGSSTTTPYSYNFLVTNSQTSNVIFSSIQSSSSTSNTITFRLPEAANDIGKLTFTANVLDSSVPAYNALASTTFTAYNAFYPVAITSSPSPAQGSPVTLNMIVTGGDPTYTYNFLVTNTFVTPVNIVYNSITTGVSATNDVLTFTIPTSSQNANAVGTLTLTGNVLDSASSPNNVLITNTMIVESQATCIPSISNTLVNFGSVQAGGFAPTANAVQINNVGTGAGNIIIYSTSGTTGNWVYLSNSFLVGNTLWDLRSRSANNGNQLTNSITTDTFNSLGAGDAADLYFGLNVPAGQPSGTYTQGITVALSCGSSSAINYVPITLSNSQNSATPSDFQQQITFSGSSYSSYANSNLSNVEFTTGSGGTGTVLNAWCESGCSNSASSSTFWVNMGTDTIGISSNVIIYMNFMGSSSPVTNGYTGYAPQLYCASGCEQTSYAQYDNGASVFANYWNFEGTSLPAGWSSAGANSINYAVSNYLQVGTGTAGTIVGVQYETALTSPLLVDTLVKSDTVSGGTPTAGLELSTSNTLSAVGLYDDGYLDGNTGAFSSGMEIYSANSVGGLTGIISTSGASAPFALTNQWLATGSEALDVNYVQEVSASDSTVTYGNYYIGYIDSGGIYQHNTVYQWLRTREYPPNGIMPSVTFGSVA